MDSLWTWGCAVDRVKGFTKTELLALQPEQKRYLVRHPDYLPLYLVVFPSGAKRWYVDFKVGRKHEREKVGKFPELGIDDALKVAKGKVGRASTGNSPAEARRSEKAKKLAQVPLPEAWEAYKAHRLAHADERRKRAVRFEEWTWGKHVQKAFADRLVDSLTRADVARWFVDLTAKSGPVAANRARALLSGILTFWAGQVELGMLNPCREVRPNREKGRERYLSAGELRAWWRAVLATPEVDSRELLAILTLTAARQGTLRAMCWEELDWQGKSWRIPGEKMKAGRECVLPLSIPALGVLRARWERLRRPEKGCIFPLPDGQPRRELREPFNDTRDEAGISDFTPHDCRRTAATAAAEAGVDSAIVAALLGHVDKTVLGRYRKVTPSAAAAASERMAAALLKPAGLEPGDFAKGLPAAEVMRQEEQEATLLAFRAQAAAIGNEE